jgi:hypothetical protein
MGTGADILAGMPATTDPKRSWLEFLYQLPADFLSVAQRLQFMLMIEASWDQFHAPTVIRDLLQQRDLWHGALMLTDNNPLWPLPYLDEYWNVDTLYILSSGKDPESLRAIADRWNADVSWIEDGKKPKPHKRDISEILRVWWP